MKAFLFPIVLASAANLPEIRQHLDYESMAENFRAISAKQAQGGAIDQATFDQIQVFIGQISTTVKDALQVDLDHAQSTYNRSRDDVEACDTTRCEDHADYTTDHAGPADQSKIDFDNCKADEQTEFNNMTTHCDNVDNLVNGWNAGQHCPVPDFSGGDTDAVETYMICICAFVDTHKDDYYDKRQKCADATAVWTAQVTECETEQNDMDADFCSEQTAIQTMCHDYTQCRDREEGEHTTTRATVEDWERVMHAQRVSLEQLICFGNHILDNNTDLNGCTDDEFADCLSYTDCPLVIYTNYAARMLCDEPNDARLPCHSNYVSQVCNAYTVPWGTGDVPCVPCVPCFTVTHPFQEWVPGPRQNCA